MGIDPSITATGVCRIHDNRPPHFHTEKTKSDVDLGLRLWHLSCCIWANTPPNTQPLLAVIETPVSPLALGKHMGGNGTVNNYYAYGVVYEMLGKFHVPYVEVAPTQLKVVATNKGNATKDEVVEAFWNNPKLDQSLIVNHNEIDAYWLAMIGWEVWELQRETQNSEYARMPRKPFGGWLDLSDKAYDVIDKLEIKGKY